MHSRFLCEIIFQYRQVFSFKPLTFFIFYCTIEWIKKVIKSGILPVCIIGFINIHLNTGGTKCTTLI